MSLVQQRNPSRTRDGDVEKVTGSKDLKLSQHYPPLFGRAVAELFIGKKDHAVVIEEFRHTYPEICISCMQRQDQIASCIQETRLLVSIYFVDGCAPRDASDPSFQDESRAQEGPRSQGRRAGKRFENTGARVFWSVSFPS